MIEPMQAFLSGPEYFILVDGEPVAEPSYQRFLLWKKTADRTLARNHTWHGVEISTVFLGYNLDTQFSGTPVLWETCIFGGAMNGYTQRYSSREDAVEGHWLLHYMAGTKSGPVRRKRLTKKLWMRYGRALSEGRLHEHRGQR